MEAFTSDPTKENCEVAFTTLVALARSCSGKAGLGDLYEGLLDDFEGACDDLE